MDKDWFRKSSNEVLQALETDIDSGLSAVAAAKQLKAQGPNELTEAEKQSTLGLLLKQFKNPLLIILLAGAGISSMPVMLSMPSQSRRSWRSMP